MRRSVVLAVLAATLSFPAFALSPGFEHFVITAGRGPGANGSMWATDLYAFNPNEFDVTVDIYWLAQNQNNASATPVTVTIPARRSVTVKDIIKNVLGQDRAFGGFRIVARQGVIAGSAYVYDMNGPNGSTLEAIPVEGGIYTTSAAKRASNLNFTQIFGIEESADFRTNFLGVGVDPNGTTFNLRVFDANGVQVLAADGVRLGPWEPKIWPLSTLGVRNLAGGYIQVTVTSGGAMFAASKVSNRTNDPHTLEQWVPLGQ